jgi:hypothetical protein
MALKSMILMSGERSLCTMKPPHVRLHLQAVDLTITHRKILNRYFNITVTDLGSLKLNIKIKEHYLGVPLYI